MKKILPAGLYVTKLYIVQHKNEVPGSRFQIPRESLFLLTWNLELGTWNSD
jgi:hypothetical protein